MKKYIVADKELFWIWRAKNMKEAVATIKIHNKKAFPWGKKFEIYKLVKLTKGKEK